ncbi:PhoU domain-containing protein [Candidatus Pyrohabitans sp.]
MQTRKIYMSGGSTYIMSLPKKWVQRVGLREGDSVVVTEREGALTVEAREREEESREVTVKISQVESGEVLERLLISYYLIGYDTIKILLDDAQHLKYREVARRIPDLLVGVEIVEDTDEALTLEILLNERKMPTVKAMRRIDLIVSSMLAELIRVPEDRDEALARDIIEREKEVDRLYFLVVRQLKGAVRYHQLAEKLGIANPRDALGYRMVVKNFERIADHCENIAQLYLRLLAEEGELADCVALAKLTSQAYRKASKAFFTLDMHLAQEVFSHLKEIRDLQEKILNHLFQSNIKAGRAMLLKGVMDSLNRIASYSSDIAEIAINVSVEVPE